MFDSERSVYLKFHIDANRINAKANLDNMNKLEAWRDAGVIMMEMSLTAQSEAISGGDVKRSRKANSYIYTLTEASIAEEPADLRAIEFMLFPRGAKTKNEHNDVDIVFNAKKYGAILVTNDGSSKRQPGGILGRREELRGMGIKVMTDAEAVSLIKTKICQRDSLLRERVGSSLPKWVGTD